MKHPEKISLLVVLAIGFYLVATSAFYPLDFLSVFDAKRILQLVLFSFLTVFALAWKPLRQQTIAQLGRLSLLHRVLLGIFFTIGLISSLRLDHPSYALVDVAMIFVMMVLITIVAASRDLAGRQFDRWAVVLVAVMGGFVIFEELVGFVAGWSVGSEYSFNMALIHFGHPRFFNQLQTWTIPVLTALPLLFSTKRWIKLACVALLGLQWFLVIAIAARGTAVSLLLASTFIALWLPEQRKFWLKYQLAGLLAGVLIYSSVLFLNGLLIDQSQAGKFYSDSVGRSMAHTSGRTKFWKQSIEDAVQHPILGTGPTRYACESKLKLPAHPHNFLFRIMGEWGMIALLAVLLLAVTIGLAFIGKLKHTSNTCQADPPLNAMVSTGLIAGVIHACLSGLLIMPASQVTMIFVAGWALSLSREPQSPTNKPVLTGTILLAGAILACITLVFATAEITQLRERTGYAIQHGEMVPRFWQDGKVCAYSYAQAGVAK